MRFLKTFRTPFSTNDLDDGQRDDGWVWESCVFFFSQRYSFAGNSRRRQRTLSTRNKYTGIVITYSCPARKAPYSSLRFLRDCPPGQQKLTKSILDIWGVWGYLDSSHAVDQSRGLEKAVTEKLLVMVQIRILHFTLTRPVCMVSE